MLEADGITVAYGATEAVSRATMRVRAGELVALVGPNGAGKSSLIAALAGDAAPASGDARLNGRIVGALKPRELARERAVLEQSPSVAAPFSVRALAGLGLPREIAPTHAKEIVDQCLETVALADRGEERIHALSGGQQRRAHLARVLAQLTAGRALGGGKALLLDEPTAGIDVAHQIKVMGAARRQADAGSAVLASLHDLSLAAAYADRVIVMRAGRIVSDDAPEAALTTTLLSKVYGAPLDAVRGPDGALIIAPRYA